MISDDDRIAELLLLWEESVETGQEVDVGQLCAEEPQLIEAVKKQIAALKQMAWMTNGSDVDAVIPNMIGDRYQVERLLGEGGHGKVFLCHDTELDRLVAIKISNSRFLPSLKDEAQRIAKLRHDHIVSIHDVTDHDGAVAIVFDFVDGVSLEERLQIGSLETQHAVSLVSTIADALQHAHDAGFIHRDIKPSNILLDESGKPFLTDFGISTSTNDTTNDSFGTLAYSAPEQTADQKHLVGPQTDVYSLGVVLFESLTGQLPYAETTPSGLREAILLRTPIIPSEIDPTIPEWLDNACEKALQKHPNDRFSSAEEMGQSLKSPIRRRLRSPRWFPLIGCFLFGVLVTWFAIESQPEKPRDIPAIASDVVVPGNADTLYFDAINFDGQTRILTPVERFAPCTLEAWVRPDRFEDRCHFIIGSDIPGNKGIGLGICSVVLSAEHIAEPTITKSPRSVLVRKWAHVAAVFAKDETRLYWNGWLVETGPPTKNIGGTNFVIGNVGEDHAIDYFLGWMRAIRISKGERFVGSRFVPENEFIADDPNSTSPAILLYDETSIEGSRVIDRSGQNNHGLIVRVE